MKLKARHKLIPAVAMLAVSAIVLGSASFAWFTMSKTVTATGINLTAVAPTNLLIAQAKDNTGAAPVDVDYGETVALTPLTGKLKPASTLDGVLFFKVDKGLGTNGIPKENNTIEAVTGDPLKWTTTQVSEGYYADYDLWLKTTGTAEVKVMVDPTATKVEATSNDALKDSVRFAVLDSKTPAAAFTGKTNYIWNNKRDKATEFGDTVLGPINATTATYTGIADANLMGLAGQTTVEQKTIFTVAKGTPTKITVRVWIEGQAAACINTNAAQAFNLTVAFTEAAATATP